MPWTFSTASARPRLLWCRALARLASSPPRSLRSWGLDASLQSVRQMLASRSQASSEPTRSCRLSAHRLRSAPSTSERSRMGAGADIVLEFTGHPQAFNEGLDLIRRGGRYVIVGQ